MPVNSVDSSGVRLPFVLSSRTLSKSIKCLARSSRTTGFCSIESGVRPNAVMAWAASVVASREKEAGGI